MIQDDNSIRAEAMRNAAPYELGKHEGHKAEMDPSGYPNGWHAHYSAIAGNPTAHGAAIKDAAAAQYAGLHRVLGTVWRGGYKGVVGV